MRGKDIIKRLGQEGWYIFFGNCADALKILAKTPADKVTIITLKDDDPKAFAKWQKIKTTAESSPYEGKKIHP